MMPASVDLFKTDRAQGLLIIQTWGVRNANLFHVQIKATSQSAGSDSFNRSSSTYSVS